MLLAQERGAFDMRYVCAFLRLTELGEPDIQGEVTQKARADDAARSRHKQAPACFLMGRILIMVERGGEFEGISFRSTAGMV